MVYIVRTRWAGLSGGPGITQMAIDADPPGGFMDTASAQDIVDAVRQFWLDQNGLFSNDVTLTVDPAIDSYATTNGELGATIVAPVPPAAVTGSSADAYSAVSGYRFNILTAGIKNNRRVRGKIFVVPAVNNVYTTAGTISASTITVAVGAAVTLQTQLAAASYELGVWSRPSEVGVSTDGTWYPTTGMTVNPKVAVLRGRRD